LLLHAYSRFILECTRDTLTTTVAITATERATTHGNAPPGMEHWEEVEEPNVAEVEEEEKPGVEEQEVEVKEVEAPEVELPEVEEPEVEEQEV